MSVDEDGTLEISTDVTNLLVDDLSIYVENTGGNTSWINGNNEIQTEGFTTWLE